MNRIRRRLSDAADVHLRARLRLPVLLVGVGGGLVGAAYVGLLRLLERVLAPDHHGEVAQIVVLATVGAAITLAVHFGGEAGSVELLVDNIHVLGGAESARNLRSLLPASLLGVAAGSTLGPEAPLVQTTGVLGTMVGTRARRSADDVRILTITGMAAGFTVLFGAPLGSAFFALEILHRRGLQYYEALLPAVVGALSGYGVFLVLEDVGIGPVWRFPPVGALHTRDLAVAALVGFAGVAGGAVFAALTRVSRAFFGCLPRWAAPAAGGLALGLLALWSPYALTNGETQVAAVTTGGLAVGTLAVAAIAKLVGAAVAMGAGWKGGFIIPLFFVGAVGGQLLHHLLPGIDATALTACMMVALCTAVTKTPIGSTLVVTEMAGLALLPVTLVAATVAVLAGDRISIIESQRHRTPVAVAEFSPG